jgi:hypothetical protein
VSDLSLIAWLKERLDNCRRIAAEKRGADRQGWLEDAGYFLRAIEAIQRLVEASADEHVNSPLRMYIALKLLRAWNSGTAGFDSAVVQTVNAWIDNGEKGPIPWPDSPFFAEWARANNLSRVGDYVGFRFTAKVKDG